MRNEKAEKLPLSEAVTHLLEEPKFRQNLLLPAGTEDTQRLYRLP